INPHDICYMAIRDFASTDHARQLISNGVIEIETLDRALHLPEGMSREEFFRSHCPPLPGNFEPQQDEPEAIRNLLAQRPFRNDAREKWSDERWRLHRWAYHRLTEMVDVQIGRVMDALRESGKERNTLVIFTSDHGDMDSSHRMEHKTVFYDEACRVPLIVSRPGMIPSGVIDRDNLISTGLDLFPTLCDAAGINTPDDLQGTSMLPAAEGKVPASPREHVRVENEIGRMIVTHDYKYMLHDEGDNREQLIDLRNDPGEMRNAIGDSDRTFNRERHRKLFEKAFG
ncbi:sulfatase, partial [Candidatus Latescibacterota bacterium]